MRTLNVAEMTLNELATVLWNSPCPVARQTVLDEMKARREIFSRR